MSEHTFVICAYKESPYLEECIESLKNQTVGSEIIVSTATPSAYLENMCKKYNIAYEIRLGNPEISADWNYGLSVAKTSYVTLAHQDDIYESQYVEKVLAALTKKDSETNEKTSIIFTDYYEIMDGEKKKNSLNLQIKGILLSPLKNCNKQNKICYKRASLRFGNAIACPTVTYNMDYINELLCQCNRDCLFNRHFRSNLDWEAWEWLSTKQGAFLYIPQSLMGHRIHEGSETSVVINDKKRTLEDYEMFCKFWPKWLAKVVTKAYKQSEKGNKI